MRWWVRAASLIVLLAFAAAAGLAEGYLWEGAGLGAQAPRQCSAYWEESGMVLPKASGQRIKKLKLSPARPAGYRGANVTLRAALTPYNPGDLAVSYTQSTLKLIAIKPLGGNVVGYTFQLTGKPKSRARVQFRSSASKKLLKSVSFTIKPTPVRSVSLNRSSCVLQPGEQFQLVASVLPQDATNKALTWSSSKKSVATVSKNGLVTANKPGTARLTVKTKSGGERAVCTVTVPEVPVKSVSLNRSEVVLRYGGRLTLKASLLPTDATNRALRWSSSNARVASVNSRGQVRAKGRAGQAVITARASNGKTAQCVVYVSKKGQMPTPTVKPTATPTRKPTVRPTATPTRRPTATPASGIAQMPGKVIELVNQERAQRGLPELKRDAELMRAAAVRSEELAVLFSHTRPDGTPCFTVSDLVFGENIAYGYRSAGAVMEGWMNSTGHRANILSEAYAIIGVGAYKQDGVIYWVQLFGR